MAATIRRVPQDYATIALAHAAANSGDIIYIATQQTSASIILTKAVHLVGAGGVDAVVNDIGTSFGINRSESSSSFNYALVTYNLTAEEAAKVPFLLIENLLLNQSYSSAATRCIYLGGAAPAGGIYVNRCMLRTTTSNCSFIEFYSSSWQVVLERCDIVRGASGTNYGAYTRALAEGHIVKCLGFAPTASDNTQNWQTKDYVTTATEGYGTTPSTGVTLQMGDLDYSSGRLYGTVTDIPNFVLPSAFEIRLYGESGTFGSNTPSMLPLDVIPLTLTTQHTDFWDGSWEFNYLSTERRYGVLINPPDGMQGHWLRWYNPEAL